MSWFGSLCSTSSANWVTLTIVVYEDSFMSAAGQDVRPVGQQALQFPAQQPLSEDDGDWEMMEPSTVSMVWA